MPCRFTASAGEEVFLFRAPIGSDARKPAVERIEEAARFEIVHMLSAQVDTHLGAAHAIEHRERSGQYGASLPAEKSGRHRCAALGFLTVAH
jgi:hypothetical protein